ncbi:MAG: cytochrome C, partial [Gammaproteobacteria bacterium]|nr:cytochrome C [Gammaproteobacteria bacterium]
AHAPYTDASLIRAIAAGTNINDQPMSPLMPRYALADGDLGPLVAYLKQLSNTLSPGVTDSSVRFATIIAPGVDATRRDLMLRMIRDAFRQRNFSQSPRSGQMRTPLESIPHQRRNWELAVWELTGAPDTWAAQLTEYYAREPAFAVVSGLSNGTWTPVHRFCEEQRLPCLFPSVDLPGDTESFYSLYFSRGVALEAAVLAKHLREAKKPPRRVVQVHRDDPVANAAAAALAGALATSGITLEDRIFDPAQPKAAGRDLGTADVAAVLWLRTADLAALAKTSPKPPAAALYLSARMAGDDLKAYPQTWRPGVQLIYPYAIGEEREKNVRTLKGWLQTYGLPLVDESFQSEVFFNLLLLTDVTTQILDNYYRDYFVERTEDMLGQFVDRAQSAQSMLGQGANVSAYPRLSLGAGQRFASKGAYIARFDKHGTLVAQTDWIVP